MRTKRIKRKVFTLLFLAACWTSYHDLTAGSLPASGETHHTGQTAEQAAVPFKSVTIQPGDTLLSVAEQLNEADIPVSRIISDFKLLNPSVDPNHLRIGETYAFPFYGQANPTSSGK